MKKFLFLLAFVFSIFSFISVNANYNTNLENDPIFMENVYGFINSADYLEYSDLTYCEQVYLEATRRREYTSTEINKCGKYFQLKNAEEIAYKKYMLNNRELFY